MPATITDAFGTAMEVCSISTMMKAQLPKLSWVSEAEWAQDVKKGALYTLRQKAINGEIKLNTVVGRTPNGGKMVYKKVHGYDSVEISFPNKAKFYKPLEDFEYDDAFLHNDWDLGPNMAQMAKQAQAVVDSSAKLEKYVNAGDVSAGDKLATLTQKATGAKYDVEFDHYDETHDYLVKLVPQKKDLGSPIPLTKNGVKSFLDSDGWQVEYKVGQTPPLPAAAKLPPVASTSKSTGLLTNEEAATYFVKVKDQLALEKGINIKGASTKLDELVYKTIADQTGYTPAELLAKVEAYKGGGKKLSALKKKVMKDSGNPKQEVTIKAVNKATEAVKKEELKPEEVVLVWDDEAVAKAYIKAKDNVVANNDKGWTLYTKNPDFDDAILKKMQAELGPIKQDVADTAIANYIANNKKLSVLKKQMIKNGELTPEADTLKKSGVKVAAKAEGPVVNTVDDLVKWVDEVEDLKPGDVLGTFTSYGKKYEIRFDSFGTPGNPKFYVKGIDNSWESIYDKAGLKKLEGNGNSSFDFKVGGKPKPAPKETGAGQVGKVTEDPKVIGPKQTLTEAQEKAVFEIWESSNLPIASPGFNLYVKAKSIAKNYDLGDDVLPILRALDKYKAEKFGVPNGNLYEKKVAQFLKDNPTGVPKGSTGQFGGYTTGPKPEAKTETWGELPEDSTLFELIGDSTMSDLARSSMKRPTREQQSVLRAYSGSYYREINNHLREGGSMTTKGQHIQDAMAPLPKDITVRRGTSLNALGVNSIEELTGSVGKVFREPGFSSTAVGGGQFSGQVNLVIQAPKGTPSVWLKPYSSFSHENELLLAANTRYKILKVERIADGYATRTMVHVRVEIP